MSLIELDVSEPWQPPDTAPPARPVRRWVAAALVGLATLALLTAAVRPVSLDPRLVVEGSGVQWAVASPAAIFVLHQPNQGVAQLDAYRLSDGRQLWSKPFAQTTTLLFADEHSVVVGAAVGIESVAGLDPATGDVRWQRSGYDAAQSTGRLVVVQAVDVRPNIEMQPEEGQPKSGTGAVGLGHDLAGLDPATGDVIWSFTTLPDADDAYLGGDDDPDSTDGHLLVELTHAGLLRLYDLDTGALKMTTQLSEGAQIAGFDLIGDLLLAVQGKAGRLTAYDLKTGRLVWQRPAIRDGFLHDCGEILCLARDTSISGVDWATGRQLWRLDGYVGFQQLDRAHLLATTTHEYDSNGAFVDAGTGRITGYLPNWIVLAAADDSRVVVWRPSPNGGALIGVLDRDSKRITVFGHTEDWFVGPQCFVSDSYLACRSATRLSVWPIPGSSAG